MSATGGTLQSIASVVVKCRNHFMSQSRKRNASRQRKAHSRQRRRALRETGSTTQLPLVLKVPSKLAAPVDVEPTSTRPPTTDRLAGLDQRISTREILRIVGVNRSTIFRWRKRNLFPEKYQGGYRRSDVEAWLAGDWAESKFTDRAARHCDV